MIDPVNLVTCKLNEKDELVGVIKSQLICLFYWNIKNFQSLMIKEKSNQSIFFNRLIALLFFRDVISLKYVQTAYVSKDCYINVLKRYETI